MTTVVACLPLLAMVCDSRVSHGEGRFKSSKKIQKSGKLSLGCQATSLPVVHLSLKSSRGGSRGQNPLEAA